MRESSPAAGRPARNDDISMPDLATPSTTTTTSSAAPREKVVDDDRGGMITPRALSLSFFRVVALFNSPRLIAFPWPACFHDQPPKKEAAAAA